MSSTFEDTIKHMSEVTLSENNSKAGLARWKGRTKKEKADHIALMNQKRAEKRAEEKRLLATIKDKKKKK